ESCMEKSNLDVTWAQFDRMLECERTTPFGVPSEPEVKRMTPALSGDNLGRLRRVRRPITLSPSETLERTSSSMMTSATDRMDSRERSSLAFSMNVPDVSTVLICAVWQADTRL